MSIKEKPLFTFSNSKIYLLFYGIVLTFIYFIIYIIVALMLGKIDYFSFFFNNISNHIILTIFACIHVGLLGLGILLIMIAFFNMSPKINSFKDRFEIILLLHKKKIIPFNLIKNIDTKLVYSTNEGFWSKKVKKECRLFFNNPIYNFYLSYLIEGYYDNMEIDSGKDKDFLLRKCFTSKDLIMSLLNILQKNYNINKPFLPKEYQKIKTD
jgi:hypothetical protein